MFCTAAWRNFSFSSLVAWPLGLSCGFSPTSACGPPTGVCSQGFPGAHKSAPVRRGHKGGSSWGRESACHSGDMVRRRRRRLPGCGSPAYSPGGRVQCVGREAAMAALPLAHHSTMVLHFYGILSFLHKNSRLQISLLLSHQAVSSQPTTVLSLGLFSKPHVPASSPLCTSGHTSQAEACRAVVRTICVSLTLSCLPQTSCCTLL